jgi:hypothetical protein
MNPAFNPYTFSALPLVVLFNGHEISKATGFILRHADQHYLISNVHVFSGLDAIHRKPLDPRWLQPDEIQVTHPRVGGGYVKQTYRLVSEGDHDNEPQSLWLEHPVFSWMVDVGALPIELPANASHVPLFESDLDLPGAEARPIPHRVGLSPTLQLDVIGYPFGRRGGSELFGIWTTASVASEPAIGFEGTPSFLVDSRTRPGNSGSPVIFYRDLRPFRDAVGEVRAPLGPYAEFVGVYSHRIDKDADVGVVFNASAVRAVVTQEHF